MKNTGFRFGRQILIILVVLLLFKLASGGIYSSGTSQQNPEGMIKNSESLELLELKETETQEDPFVDVEPIAVRKSGIFNFDFLSDIVTFEIAIFAFLIPLSFEMISRISERYNSEIITSFFGRKVLPLRIQIFILLSSVLTILYGLTGWVSSQKAILAWLVILPIILFFLVIYFITKFLIHFRLYLTSPEVILNELFEDAKEAIK